MKRFLYFFISTIVIGFVLYFGMKLQLRIEYEASSNFNYRPIVIISIAFPIVVGMLLRLPLLILEIKEKRQWIFDWQKFIAIAIPTLFIIIMFILSYSGIQTFINFILIGGANFISIAGIVLGYTLLDCLKE